MCFKHNSINNNEFIKIEKFIANIVGETIGRPRSEGILK